MPTFRKVLSKLKLGSCGRRAGTEGRGHWFPVSPAGIGPMIQMAARLMASRALQQHWPASAAVPPSPGGAITTTAPVSVWGPRVEGHHTMRVIMAKPAACFPVQERVGGSECA